jgi:ribose 5-phosphate isomerase
VAPRQPAPLTYEEAVERLSLAIDGYDFDVAKKMSVIKSRGNPAANVDLFVTLLKKFLVAESTFAGQVLSYVISL